MQLQKVEKCQLNLIEIEAFYEEKDNSGMDIKLVKAHKKVVVKDENLKIVGGRLAEYNLKKDYFSIFGKNLILTSEDNKLESNNKMEYWILKVWQLQLEMQKPIKVRSSKLKQKNLVGT